ncbi:unnamed protein product [Cunninghamella blakesleeana]
MAVDLYYVFASSIAAIIARFVTHPIDTIKTRLQVSSVNTTLKDILTTSPLKTLYDGLLITLILCVPALTVYLSSYDTMKQILSEKYNWDKTGAGTYMVSGLVAEALAGIFFTPMEVLKSRLQVLSSSTATATTATQSHTNRRIDEENVSPISSLLSTNQNHHHSINNNHNDQIVSSSSSLPSSLIENNTTKATLKLARHIYTTEGWQGFYQGYWITLVVFVPQTMIYFLVYENLKLQFMDLNFFIYLFCSLMASIISVGVCNPLDVVKTRWQVYHHHHLHLHYSINTPTSTSGHNNLFYQYYVQSFDTMMELIQVMRQMYRDEGYRGFLKGTFARIAWGAPMTTISFCVFEVLKDLHNNAN